LGLLHYEFSFHTHHYKTTLGNPLLRGGMVASLSLQAKFFLKKIRKQNLAKQSKTLQNLANLPFIKSIISFR